MALAAEVPGDDEVQVSVVVPTRNEAPNIALLVERLGAALRRDLGPDLTWEVIFVDDSDDATPAAIQAQVDAGHPVALHHRRAGNRPGGLGGAVRDGFEVARGRTVAVMDADLQHPPEVIPRLLAPIMAGEADLVSGNRYAAAGDRGGLAGPWRRLVASSSRRLVHAVIPRSRVLRDPMSGLFAFDRGSLDGVDLQPNGFKILLEVIARGDWQQVGNVSYRFDRRHAGHSKASLRQGWLFAHHLLRLARVTRCPPDELALRRRAVVGG
ncbi:glycosyltransferase [Acidiferrimicrobium sp. IK]|uniref:glycosyltransferase n=1 Tax=Acidiferrimicrobium sp. IK TaxID=2871700 RepID=UPI0021CB63B3|nr:glycosyltransferase [Acidiferrimicrobium sp. IK]MCU4183414.1 glycosyltransferase [Acidiferrimicrobium sp. IK]